MGIDKPSFFAAPGFRSIRPALPSWSSTVATTLLPKNAVAGLVDTFDEILTCRTFAEIRTLELKKLPGSWQLFRDAVIPAILDEG